MSVTFGNIETILISSRIRLARNFIAYPFPQKMDDAQALDIVYLVEQGLKSIGEFKKYVIGELTEQQRAQLQEQYLISSALRKGTRGAAFVSTDRTISIMVNEEDHLRQQYIFKELDLYKAYERLSAIDEQLGSLYDFAFDEKLGYLTACPSNIGTGMRASVMLFLPGLVLENEMKGLLRTLKQSGLTIRGAFGEGSVGEGYLYQISNEQTLGESEKEILDKMRLTALQICAMENQARRDMLEKSNVKIKDKCLRAYGALTHCAILPLKECTAKLADVRMGIMLGFFEVKALEEFDGFVDALRPASFKEGNELWEATEEECDEKRAEFVGKILPELVQVNYNE